MAGSESFEFSLQWLPSDEDLLLSGNNELSVISRNEEGEWTMVSEKAVSHSRPISSLFAISDEILLTYSV